APDLRGLQHVGLVDTADFLPPLARGLKCDMGDPGDLGLAIAHGIEALTRTRELAIRRSTRTPRLTEVDIAVELTNDQDVEPFCDFGLERRGADQLFIQKGRA